MKCSRCLNENPIYFYQGTRGTYCRRCIHLGGHQVEELLDIDSAQEYATLPFELTEQQKQASTEIARLGLERDILVEAVCGAGKSELMIELIEKAMSQNLHVGWMIARRQVVLELAKRLQDIFKNHKVIAVCEGHTQDLKGHLVLLTAHQLYRYHQMFDVLILDEPDAFPFKGNDLLNDLAEVAARRTKIYLSATPDKELLNRIQEHIVLNRRPHGRDLIIPKVIITFNILQYLLLVYYLAFVYREEKVLIFVPTIKQAKRLGRILKLPIITSQSASKQEILESFRGDRTGKLITTTILERGMTFEEVFVIVLDCDHYIFDEASLIQISGRVGRSFNKTKGDCLFLATRRSTAIQNCLKRLRAHNAA